MSAITRHVCDLCGKDYDEVMVLVSVTVEVAANEEGHSKREGDVCDECIDGFLTALVSVVEPLPMTRGEHYAHAYLAPRTEENHDLPATRKH